MTFDGVTAIAGAPIGGLRSDADAFGTHASKTMTINAGAMHVGLGVTGQAKVKQLHGTRRCAPDRVSATVSSGSSEVTAPGSGEVDRFTPARVATSDAARRSLGGVNVKVRTVVGKLGDDAALRVARTTGVLVRWPLAAVCDRAVRWPPSPVVRAPGSASAGDRRCAKAGYPDIRLGAVMVPSGGELHEDRGRIVRARVIDCQGLLGSEPLHPDEAGRGRLAAQLDAGHAAGGTRRCRGLLRRFRADHYRRGCDPDQGDGRQQACRATGGQPAGGTAPGGVLHCRALAQRARTERQRDPEVQGADRARRVADHGAAGINSLLRAHSAGHGTRAAGRLGRGGRADDGARHGGPVRNVDCIRQSVRLPCHAEEQVRVEFTDPRGGAKPREESLAGAGDKLPDQFSRLRVAELATGPGGAAVPGSLDALPALPVGAGSAETARRHLQQPVAECREP